MFAVIESGGKQYRVTNGDIIKIESLAVEPGAGVIFDKVLMLNDDKEIKIGTPILEGVTVTGEAIEHGRHKKIEILKFKRRKHHMKRQGHRQNYTAVKITALDGKAAEPKPT
ncbi:MAG: 50S ribosomal protein L21, partial [Gammaproteobacteria bacterium]|nr:50S ribosomal protein L21 [Gammaproteobacteria bacterium]